MRTIAGIGIDIVDIDRIADMIERHGRRFTSKTFTESECTYCQSRKIPAQHYAARFAAKEAVFKALGTGWRHGMAWTDIEVQLDSQGRPKIRLYGRAAAKAREIGISVIHISLAHCDCHATAQAVAVSSANRP